MLKFHMHSPDVVLSYRVSNWSLPSTIDPQKRGYLPSDVWVLCMEGDQAHVVDVDCDTLDSHPSLLTGYNNCIHYKVSGDLWTHKQTWFRPTDTFDEGGWKLYDADLYSEVTEEPIHLSRILMVVGLRGLSAPSGPITFRWWSHDWWAGNQLHTMQLNVYLTTIGHDLRDWYLTFSGTEKLEWPDNPDKPAITQNYYHIRYLSNDSAGRWDYNLRISPKALMKTWIPSYYWGYTAGMKRLIADIQWRADREYTYGDATADAAESIRLVNINSIAYLKDMAELGAFASSLVKMVKSIVSTIAKPIKVAVAMASAYLAIHYGYKLTVRDTQEIAEALKDYDPASMSQTMGKVKTVEVDLPGDSSVSVSVETRCTAYVDYFSIGQTYFIDKCREASRALYETDLVPSWENIWDMVPFSFVGDWFVPLGDAFARMETIDYVHTLPVRRAFYSRKIKWQQESSLDINGVEFSGFCTYEYYERACRKTLIEPPLRVDRPKGLSGHWIEATALFFASR